MNYTSVTIIRCVFSHSKYIHKYLINAAKFRNTYINRNYVVSNAVASYIKSPLLKSLSTKSAEISEQENLSSLQIKSRPRRKQRQTKSEDADTEHRSWPVVAYATAEEYDLEMLHSGLKEQNLYKPSILHAEKDEAQSVDFDVLYAVAQYKVNDEPREIFFFRDGAVVMWNIGELEISNILKSLQPYEKNSHNKMIVFNENERMDYSYSDSRETSYLHGDKIFLNSDPQNILDKYSFSNGLALSVKLGIWESSLENYVEGIEFVVNDLKKGFTIRISQEEVLRKTGELFALRHHINLSSDLLDTPDFYWDREKQEKLYQEICTYLSIFRRTRVMNEKLNHCVELVELLSHHLSDRHHVRLEWMIIILIMVEVLFEILHFMDRLH